jgi:4-hydroxybenzoate polyprenyltransferase
VSEEAGARPRGSTVPVELLAAAHPGPALVVTATATILAVVLGADGATTVLVALAFATGQLSIGWSNDWIDAARDTAASRTDKPVARGTVRAGTVARAATAAAVATVPLSVALGVAAGLAHLVVVASGWAYNLGLKATVWSWAPYALAFGLVPAVVTLALPGHPLPPVWLVGVGALLGTGAHLANVLPDLEDDRMTGVRGLPHRMGRTWTSMLAPALLVAGSAIALLGPPGPAPRLAVPVLLGTVLVAVGAGAAALAGRRLLPLAAIGAIAIVDLVLLVVSAAPQA